VGPEYRRNLECGIIGYEFARTRCAAATIFAPPQAALSNPRYRSLEGPPRAGFRERYLN
jgi:hypothetical protein